MDIHEAACALGRKGGLKGGPARAAKLSAEERSRIAQHAATERWTTHSEAYREYIEDMEALEQNASRD